MRVVVTGASGFIGRRLVELLRKGRFEVRTTDVVGTPDLHLDLTATSAPERLAHELAQCDGLVHLAAVSGGGQFLAEHERMIVRQNLSIDLAVAEAVSSHPGLRSIVYASSAMVYQHGVNSLAVLTGRADEPFQPPSNGYGMAKLQGERLFRTACEPATSATWLLRLASVYGPGQVRSEANRPGERHVVPDLVLRARSTPIDEPLMLMSDPGRLRSFVYVDDVCDAIERSLVSPHLGSHALAVTADEPTAIGKLAELICELVGRPVAVRASLPTDADTTQEGFSNVAVRDLLGWRPTVNLRSGLGQCVQIASDERLLEEP